MAIRGAKASFRSPQIFCGRRRSPDSRKWAPDFPHSVVPVTQSIIEAARSSRSKCGECKKKIEKGELRFGSYQERWESHRWYHLACGAAQDREDFLEAVEEYGGLDDLDQILEDANNVGKGTRTPRVEAASSGRSKCVECGEKIEKGALRGVLFREVDPEVWRKGFTHLTCMAGVSDLDRDDLITQVLENSLLTEEQAETVVSDI